MAIYFTLFGLLFLATVFLDSDDEYNDQVLIANKYYFLFVFFLLLALVVGVRFQIGADWFSYEYYYDMMERFSFLDIFTLKDPGYQLINFASHSLGLGMMGVNLTCGVIFSYALVKFSTKQSDMFLSLLVAFPYLFIVVGMGYARQAVAIAFLMLAITQLYEEKIIGYVVLLVIGAFFHKTAIVMVPIAFLITERNRNQKIFFGGLFSVIVIYLFFSSSIDTLMYSYVESDRYNSQGAFIRVVMSFLPGVLFLMFRDRFNFSPIIYQLVLLLSCASVLLFVLLLAVSSLSTIIDRFALYIIPLQMLVLSNLQGLFTRWNKFTVHLLVCGYLFAVLFVWLNFASHANAWVPYKTYNVLQLGYDQ